MIQKVLVESLAMDLKRVALGLHRGSFVMAERFKQEAFKRSEELGNELPRSRAARYRKQVLVTQFCDRAASCSVLCDNKNSRYLSKLVNGMKKSLSQNTERVAEDVLMYSTLFQNYALKKL